jgi:hypothetical protein
MNPSQRRQQLWQPTQTSLRNPRTDNQQLTSVNRSLELRMLGAARARESRSGVGILGRRLHMRLGASL